MDNIMTLAKTVIQKIEESNRIGIEEAVYFKDVTAFISKYPNIGRVIDNIAMDNGTTPAKLFKSVKWSKFPDDKSLVLAEKFAGTISPADMQEVWLEQDTWEELAADSSDAGLVALATFVSKLCDQVF